MSRSIGWAPRVPLGDVLQQAHNSVSVKVDSEYPNFGIFSYGRGLFQKEPISGSSTSASTLYQARTGQFVYSRLFAFEGAYGYVSPEFDGAFVSNEFPLFDCDEHQLDSKYLAWFFRRPSTWSEAAMLTTGMGNRRQRIKPEALYTYRIPLPSLADQRRVVAKIESIAGKIEAAKDLSGQSDAVSDGLLASVYREIIENSPRMPLAEVAPLDRRPVEVTTDGVYPGVSVRSFGRGCFHNPPLYGSEITWQKPHLVREGDILVSNIKAWEGAIAVARPEDDGRFGSHRYLTFRPIEGVATARVLAFHLLSDEGLYEVGMASPGSADRNRTLRSKEMLAIQVPVPDYGKQLEFDSLVDRMDTLAEERRRVRRELEAMIPSILDRAFRGEL